MSFLRIPSSQTQLQCRVESVQKDEKPIWFSSIALCQVSRHKKEIKLMYQFHIRCLPLSLCLSLHVFHIRVAPLYWHDEKTEKICFTSSTKRWQTDWTTLFAVIAIGIRQCNWEQIHKKYTHIAHTRTTTTTPNSNNQKIENEIAPVLHAAILSFAIFHLDFAHFFFSSSSSSSFRSFFVAFAWFSRLA